MTWINYVFTGTTELARRSFRNDKSLRFGIVFICFHAATSCSSENLDGIIYLKVHVLHVVQVSC